MKLETNAQKTSFSERLRKVVPGGAHTYSRGDDQFPTNAPQILDRGEGPLVWDAFGNKFIDFGMGLRSVSIGYSEPEINCAAQKAMNKGNNLTRASLIELEAAERLVDMVDSVDMVKFAKNGSNATSAAVKLARAYTGRKMVARCTQHPFFSFDDWFIGNTPITKGIPEEVQALTLQFSYNDLSSLEALEALHPSKIACVILEPATTKCPKLTSRDEVCCGKSPCSQFPSAQENFLTEVQSFCKKNGIIFILDETITGFRWDMKGAQFLYGVQPDLTTFGKAMANGFSVAALAGNKEIMKLGDIHTEGEERLFLLSTTHGAEMCGLAAFMATMDFMEKHDAITSYWNTGQRLLNKINNLALKHGIEDFIKAGGIPPSPILAIYGQNGEPCNSMRTLFLQEMIRNGVLMPWIAICFRHDDATLEKVFLALDATFEVCSKAVKEGVEKYLQGPAVKPVFRKNN